MEKDKSTSPTPVLRSRAEEQLGVTVPGAELFKADVETRRLLHELEVHRIELEMQNAELRQARDEAETSLEKYTDLYEFAPVGYFTLGCNGTINAVNLRGASLLGLARTWLFGRRFEQLVTEDCRTVFNDFFANVFKNQDKTICEVALQKKGKIPLFVQLEAMASISGESCGLALIDITERKQGENDLRSYARRLIEMEEELRIKLASELHDELGRDLTVLGMNMAIIKDGVKEVVPKKLTERIKDSGILIKGITQTVRNIMVGLRPPVLDDLGLLAALRWHAAQFMKRNAVNVTIQADEPFPRLTIEKETALFRISQEALMNVSKHAATQNVTIKLMTIDDMVRFTIADEGIGFLPTSSSLRTGGSGWGMTIMRERAELNGGKFQVDSAPGKGTTVSVVMQMEDI